MDLNNIPLSLLLAEIQKRSKPQFQLEEYCFDKQVAFIKDPSSFKTAVCSRRAGKTVACAAHLIETALQNPERVCIYITLTRKNAKRIIWPELQRINREFELGGVANESDLSLTMPNKSVIYVSGAKDKSEIENFRGLAISLCYLDECQSFRGYIEELIEDVITKALYDYNGTLCLIGTPGPVPTGYFYDCSTSNNWSHHSWTMFDNPWILKKSGKSAQELLQRDLDRKGVTVDDPTIQREVFARWVLDQNSLVLRYSADKNDYTELPEVAGKWEHIIGVDVGFDDADAIAVIGWNEKIKQAYLIEEVVERKQGITELATTLERLIAKYNPLRVVLDTGGLGKKIAEEMRKRFSLPIVAAEKSRKFEYLELLNDALRTGALMAKKESQFAQDSLLVEWDRDAQNPDRLKVSDRYHSDIMDAVLYAFRESLHWTHQPEKVGPKPQSPAWFEQQAQEMENRLIAELERQNSDDIWADLSWNN